MSTDERLQLSTTQLKPGDDTMSPYTLPAKINATPSNNSNYNYQSQNESPLIKLVKESHQVAKSVMSSNSQDNPLATTDSINLTQGGEGEMMMPYEDQELSNS